jgi:hypothetical protein
MAEINLDALTRVQEDSYLRARQGLISSWPRESAMNPAQLAGLLEQRRYCVLATTSAADRPAARPVSFVVVGRRSGSRPSQARDSGTSSALRGLSVVIEDGDGEDHRAVVVDGPVTIVSEPPPRVLDVWRERHGSSPTSAVAWLELQPRYLVSYSARHDRA